MTDILIVEDESHLAELERDYLQAAGFSVTQIARGDDALLWLHAKTPALVVLDLMLPGVDGLEICRQVRKHSDVPIIMTTAKVEEVDRLIGLELGADDYLCKPFSLRELVARVKTVLRRCQLLQQPVAASNRLQLDPQGTEVRFGERATELTLVEANLLRLLQHHPRQIFSREQIINQIYNDHRIVSDRTIDSHIKKLRKKLQSLHGEHDYIQSVYGAGYRFHPAEIEQP